MNRIHDLTREFKTGDPSCRYLPASKKGGLFCEQRQLGSAGILAYHPSSRCRCWPNVGLALAVPTATESLSPQ